MTESNPPRRLRVSDLPERAETRFEIIPDTAEMKVIATELGLDGLRKLRFAGQVAADGAHDWRLDADLGATVIQPCVVTLAPVTTRIDERSRVAFWPGCRKRTAPRTRSKCPRMTPSRSSAVKSTSPRS